MPICSVFEKLAKDGGKVWKDEGPAEDGETIPYRRPHPNLDQHDREASTASRVACSVGWCPDEARFSTGRL